MTNSRNPEALISSPAEATFCPDKNCDEAYRDADGYIDGYTPRVGVRFPGDVAGKTFAHCPNCGNTNLLDTRSPWEVLAEAIDNLNVLPEAHDADTAMLRLGRYDVIERVRKVAEASTCECDDCGTQRRVALGKVVA